MTSLSNSIKKYIEIFLLIILTVGPFPPSVKILIYLIIFLMCIRHTEALLRVKPLYFFLICSMVIPMILDIRNVDSSTPYSLAGFAYLAPFVFSLVYIREFDKDEFLLKLEQVLFIVTILSLVGFLLILFKPSVIEKFPTIVFYGRRVKTIGVYNAIRDYTNVNFLQRNCGIAFEPGAFQFIPNLGIAILLGKKTEKDLLFWIKIVIYAIAVITTYSTTGFVIMAVLLLVSSFSNRKHFFMIVLVLILLSGLLLSNYQYQMDKMQAGGFGSRFENTIYVIMNYSKYVFGLGSTGYDKIYNINKKIGSWDTFTNLYLRFGLVFILIFIFLNLRLYKINILVCITVVLTLLTESIVGPIIVMLYYYTSESNYKNCYNDERKIE